MRVNIPGRPVLVTTAATLIALIAGLWELGRRSFWYDEAFTVGIVDRPVGDMLWRVTHWEVNQSPYYVLMWGWFRLGHSDVFLRSLSVVFAVAAVPMIFVLGRRIADARVGALAAVLLAVHPLVVQWGQQLRAYSMVTFLVILSTVLLLRAVEEPQNTSRALLYGVVAAVTIYTQFFALGVIAVHLVWAAAARPMPRRVVAAAGAALGVLVVPLAWYLATYEGDPLAWVGDAGTNLTATARGLAGGHTVAVAVYGVAVAVGVVVVARRLVRAGRARARTAPVWPTVLPVAWLIVPVLVTVVVSATLKPLLETRFLIVVVPALVLVAAMGVCGVRWRAPAALVAAALVVVSLVGLRDWYRGPMIEDWRAAVPVAVHEAGPDGVVSVDPRLGLFAVRHYRPAGLPLRFLDADASGIERPARIVEVARDDQERSDHQPGYVAWRDAHFVPVRTRHFTGLTVTIYEAAR